MKASIPALLLPLVMLAGGAHGDCLVGGDMMFVEGQSTGYIGLECINATSFDAFESVCGPPPSNGTDGIIVEIDAVYTCPNSSSYCVQCGPRGRGAALCLDSPDVPADCVGEDESTDGQDSDAEPADATGAAEPADVSAPAPAATPSAGSSAMDRSALASVVAIMTLAALVQFS